MTDKDMSFSLGYTTQENLQAIAKLRQEKKHVKKMTSL